MRRANRVLPDRSDSVETNATPDDRAGMAWWNSLTKPERARWLVEAGSARPVDAWRAYKGSGVVR